MAVSIRTIYISKPRRHQPVRFRDRGVSGNLQLGANAPILGDQGREGRVTRRVVTESSDLQREDKIFATTSTTFQRCTVVRWTENLLRTSRTRYDTLHGPALRYMNVSSVLRFFKAFSTPLSTHYHHSPPRARHAAPLHRRHHWGRGSSWMAWVAM